MYVYRFITWYKRLRKQQQLSMKVSMRDEIGHNVANTTLNLCHEGLQEVRKDVRLEVLLTKDKIVYNGNVGDTGLSTNISGLSTSFLGLSTN